MKQIVSRVFFARHCRTAGCPKFRTQIVVIPRQWERIVTLINDGLAALLGATIALVSYNSQTSLTGSAPVQPPVQATAQL